MILAAITLGLILIGLASFVYGAIALSKYAFRVGTGQGLAVLLFPPYTFYFAFFELDQEDKNLPAASWVFGILVTCLLTGLFFPTLELLFQGRFDAIRERAKGPGEAASEAYGEEEEDEDEEEEENEADEDDDSSDSEETEESSETSSSDSSSGETDAGSTDEDTPEAGHGEADATN